MSVYTLLQLTTEKFAVCEQICAFSLEASDEVKIRLTSGEVLTVPLPDYPAVNSSDINERWRRYREGLFAGFKVL